MSVLILGRSMLASGLQRLPIGILIFASSLASAQDLGQDRRRALRTPGLVVETGAPTSQCYAIRYTSDGSKLLAAGADKVVRVWSFGAGGAVDPTSSQTLRWASYREHRGTIYAMDYLRVRDREWVAIAGYGLVAGALAILDLATGEVVHGLTQPGHGSVVTSVAFSPSGTQLAFGTYDGRVGIWKPNAASTEELTFLNQRTSKTANRVKGLVFSTESELVAISETGRTFKWVSGPTWEPQEVRWFPMLKSISDVAATKEVVATVGRQNGGRYSVAIRDAHSHVTLVPLGQGEISEQIAVDGRGERVAVSISTAPRSGKAHHPISTLTRVYDVTSDQPRVIAEFPCSYAVGCMAFAPSRPHLAVAGGNDNEVVVWDIDRSRRLDEIRSPGASIWQVGLSKDGWLLGFKREREARPSGFNDWGAGPWSVFNLRTRTWANPESRADFDRVRPIEELEGWTVGVSNSTERPWRILNSRTGRAYELPLRPAIDIRPRCYTFLNRTETKPLRLVVGHFWGMTVFEIFEDAPPQRSRFFAGHGSVVTSVAPSADQQLLVSSSRDQTVAAWSLADWPGQRELGVGFKVEDSRLITRSVAPGSPGWVAGFKPGDRIVRLASGGREILGGVGKWREIVQEPAPDTDLYVEVERAGQSGRVKIVTATRQDPLWRFFPTRAREWVLWRWRDFFYDASLHGDAHIGWQMSGAVSETPIFSRAEQLRRRFHRPERVEAILKRAVSQPEAVALAELAPPVVSLRLSKPEDSGAILAEVSAQKRSDIEASEPREVSLWINGHRLRQWANVSIPFQASVILQRSQLRAGKNHVIAQAYSRFGVRGDSDQTVVEGPPVRRRPRLMAVCVGIEDYGSAQGIPDLTYSIEDAEGLVAALRGQTRAGKHRDVTVVPLRDREATAESIIQHIRYAAQAARPDDLFVLFLAGHGWARATGEHSFDPSTFTFVTPSFRRDKAASTGLRFARRESSDGSTANSLYDALAAVPCRKLVLLDCCHSGSVDNMIRNLIPGRFSRQSPVGPIILSACAKNEEAYSLVAKGHGAFALAILEALEDEFNRVDDGDSVLTAVELATWVQERVPKLVEVFREAEGLPVTAKQQPQAFIPELGASDALFWRLPPPDH